jgi:hypothetical protein
VVTAEPNQRFWPESAARDGSQLGRAQLDFAKQTQFRHNSRPDMGTNPDCEGCDACDVSSEREQKSGAKWDDFVEEIGNSD